LAFIDVLDNASSRQRAAVRGANLLLLDVKQLARSLSLAPLPTSIVGGAEARPGHPN
jgi:hypothetical protein